MVSKSYTHEVGIKSGEARVSRPVAMVIVAAVAAVIVTGIIMTRPEGHAAKVVAAAPAHN